ncbi:unnamed protein product [Adineta steineri]|uniref:Uncharacterized protein n=1 Tax=Adineta steineri TaxID=433720 RepID=A0A818WSN4_9BILA|nr:unnamed protein product [Adineta steineri]CAF3729061.1 unnamed protein product [Adineta steineri]
MMGCKISSYELLDDYECSTNLSINQISSSVHFADETLDSFTLIWLDSESKGNTLDSLKTKSLLLQICKHCFFYENCELFFSEIEQINFENKKTLLIVSGAFVEVLLSRTNIRNIISTVIIFSRFGYKYSRLKNDFIIDICIDLRSLKTSILREISSLKLNLYENQPFQSVRLLSSCRDDGANSGVYFKYILFIEILKKMPQTKHTWEIMLAQSKDYYRAQEYRLKQIDEFHQKYSADQAIKWYLSESFVYRLVNLAFRTEDISLWYIFRSYITDLCTQLEKVHREQNEKLGNRCLKLYRGQSQLLTKEIENIKSRPNSLVATTGFFSTSYDRTVAKMYTLYTANSNDYSSVLFEIVVDTSKLKNTIFVDVLEYFSLLDEFNILAESEQEVLFNIGSVFKILNVEYDNSEQLWVIKMEATDDGTQVVKSRITSIVEQNQNQNMNFFFGQQMLEMCYYDAADYYFKRIVQELPRDHKDLGLAYDLIGDIHMRKTHWNAAFENFNKAYTIKKKYFSRNHPNLGTTLNNIGSYHQAIGNHKVAYDFYRKALKCVRDQVMIAMIKLNISSILVVRGQYLQALEKCYEILDLLEKIEPRPTSTIVVCQGIMGDIYYAKDEYDNANEFYTKAFELAKKILFIDDYHLTECIEALATLYKKQDYDDNHRAIQFCREQLLSYEKDLPENHITIAHILMILGKLSGEFDFYERALNIFERNNSQGYAFTADCLILMAKVYHEKNKFEEALVFYERAYNIQKKIYPSNHSLLVTSESLLSDLERKFKKQVII